MDKLSYHHDNLKKELIENGIRLLNEDGYDKFSLRKVATACGVSHTAPYRHFENKDELIVAITLEALNKFEENLENAVLKYPEDATLQIKEMGFLYVKFFVENPDYLQLLFLSNLTKYIDKNQKNLKCSHPFDVFLKTMEKVLVIKAGEKFSEEDKAAYILAYWGLVHGITVLIVKKQFPYQGDYLEVVRKIIWEFRWV